MAKCGPESDLHLSYVRGRPDAHVDQRNTREHVQRLRVQNVRSDASTLPGDSQANFDCLFALLPVGRACEDTEVATLGFDEAPIV